MTPKNIFQVPRLKATLGAFVLLLGCAGFSHGAIASSGFLKGSVYEQIGLQENVDPYLLYSISLVESAKAANKSANIQSQINYVSPHPYAIRTPKGAIYPKTYEEAVKVLNTQLKKYKKRELDVGLMQINGMHFSNVSKVEDLLRPEVNIKVAVKILKEAMKGDHSNMALKVGAITHIQHGEHRHMVIGYLLFTTISSA